MIVLAASVLFGKETNMTFVLVVVKLLIGVMCSEAN